MLGDIAIVRGLKEQIVQNDKIITLLEQISEQLRNKE